MLNNGTLLFSLTLLLVMSSPSIWCILCAYKMRNIHCRSKDILKLIPKQVIIN